LRARIFSRMADFSNLERRTETAGGTAMVQRTGDLSAAQPNRAGSEVGPN